MIGNSIGLLILRLGAGGFMLWFHGLPKLLSFSEKASSFPDPLDIGSTLSLILAIFAEFFCSALVVWGILTRLAAIPVVTTMMVAAFVIHAEDPFAKQEFALLYAIPFLTLIFTGPGNISIDYFLFGKNIKASKTLNGSNPRLQ